MARIKKKILLQIGETSNSEKILTGIYKFFETHGLPLDVLFDCCKERNAIPDWIDFYHSARNAGMKHDRILSKLEESISDSFGREYSEVVISRLDSKFKDNND